MLAPVTSHMKNVIISLLTLLTISANGQNFDHVDNYIYSLELNASESIESITKTITKPFKSDIDKTRAIYCWLATNIRYDYEGYETNFWRNYPSINDLISDTFEFRKGVCSGYSHLFHQMLKYVEIESVVINGYARNDLQTVFLNESNHAWNAVKINNKWNLVDVTWGRDTTSQNIDDFYFFTDPEIFILNHYPMDYKYSLLSNQYSLDDYMNFPVYTNTFYKLDLLNDISKSGYFIAKNDTVKIPFKPNFKCLLLPQIYDLEKNEWFKFQAGQVIVNDEWFKLILSRKSKFIVQLDIMTQNDSTFNIYDQAILYRIDNK